MEVKGMATNKTSGSGMNSSHGGSNPHTPSPAPPQHGKKPATFLSPCFDDSLRASLIQQIAGCFLGGTGRGLLKVLDQARTGGRGWGVRMEAG